jgi:hypothetical protein
VDVSVAAQSVVAVRWAFRQHAATEVGVLVREFENRAGPRKSRPQGCRFRSAKELIAEMR